MRQCLTYLAVCSAVWICAAAPLQGSGSASAEVIDSVSAAAAQQALQSLLSARFATPEELLSKGCKAVNRPHARNWGRLARKLSRPGSTVKIVAFGTSVTAGYWSNSNYPGWFDVLAPWLQKAFPDVKFKLVNLARGATDVTSAAICWYQDTPLDADLVVVEYSANGCNGVTPDTECNTWASPRVAKYESLLRRLIRRVPNAALLGVGVFGFVNYEAQVTQPHGSNATMVVATPVYSSGEDLHTVLARRYGAPMASVRDALYDIMYDDKALQSYLGLSRLQLLHGTIHPLPPGAKLYAEIVAYTMQQTLAQELTALQSSSTSGAVNADVIDSVTTSQVANWLPPPISPVAAQEADGDTFCAEGKRFRRYVKLPNQSGSPGGEWTWGVFRTAKHCPHRNCQIWGYNSTGVGNYLDITLDTSLIPRAVKDTLTRRVLERKSLVIFHTRGPMMASTMGVGVVTCVRGCSCEPGRITVGDVLTFASTSTELTQVGPNSKECVIRVTIKEKGEQGGEALLIGGVAIVPYTLSVPMTPVDRLLVHSQAALAGSGLLAAADALLLDDYGVPE